MAIRNNEIVAMEWMRLVSEGIISENEEIHTLKKWNQLGYIVKRGEKAVASFSVWKYAEKYDDNGDVSESSMFMKKAHFFSSKQVEKIQPIKRVSAAEMVGKKCVITIGK